MQLIVSVCGGGGKNDAQGDRDLRGHGVECGAEVGIALFAFPSPRALVDEAVA